MISNIFLTTSFLDQSGSDSDEEIQVVKKKSKKVSRLIYVY